MSPHGTALDLRVYLAPRASRNRVVGEYNGRLKLAVAASAVEGKANAELMRFLAIVFNIPKSAIEITCGLASKSKVVRLHGISPVKALAQLQLSLQKEH